MTESEPRKDWWNAPLELEDFDDLGDLFGAMMGALEIYKTTGVRAFGEQAEDLALQFNQEFFEVTGEYWIDPEELDK